MGRIRRKFAYARIIIFIALLAALIGAGVMMVQKLTSPTFLVARIGQAVQQATGRTLQVGGPPRLTLFPRIAVVLRDVRLSNPPSMEKGDFARVARLEMEIELWPLLQRRLVLHKLHLQQPQIHLLVDKKGRNNWTFIPPRRQGESGFGAQGLIRDIRLAPMVLHDGVVLFEDRRSGMRQRLNDLDMTVKLPTPASPLELKGAVNWRNQRIGFALFVKDPAQLADKGSPLEVFLKMPGAQVEYTGLAGFGQGLSLAGKVAANGDSLRGLLHWLGAGLAPQGPGFGKFSLQGALEAANARIILDRMRLQLDGSNAQGSARLDMSGKVTAISVALGVDRIITDTYLGKAPPQGRRGWSAAPVVPALPPHVRADVRLSLNELRHRHLKMGPGAARFVLNDARLSTTLEKMRFYGGTLTGSLHLNTAAKKPMTAAEFKFDGVSARPFLTDLAGFTYLSGTLSGDVDVKTFGRSEQEMVGNLAGLANLYFRRGKVHGVDLVKLLEMVQQGIVTGWQFDRNATTDFVELVARFIIVDGIAGVRQLSMKGPLVQVKGKGEVDLLRQRLDLAFDGGLVKRKEGREKTLLKIPVPLLVKGPWEHPQIYPDIAGILKDPGAALLKLHNLLEEVGAKKPGAGLKGLERKAKEKVKAKTSKKVEKQREKVFGEDEAAEKAAKEM